MMMPIVRIVNLCLDQASTPLVLFVRAMVHISGMETIRDTGIHF